MGCSEFNVDQWLSKELHDTKLENFKEEKEAEGNENFLAHFDFVLHNFSFMRGQFFNRIFKLGNFRPFFTDDDAWPRRINA